MHSYCLVKIADKTKTCQACNKPFVLMAKKRRSVDPGQISDVESETDNEEIVEKPRMKKKRAV